MFTSSNTAKAVRALTDEYVGYDVTFTYRWEGGSRFEIKVNDYSALTINVVNPRKILVDVTLTVARTKQQAIGNILEKVEDDEGNGTWLVDTKTYILLNPVVDELLDKIVKEWGLRLLETL